MKNFFIVLYLLSCILWGCNANSTFNETKSFFTQNQEIFSKMVEILNNQNQDFNLNYYKNNGKLGSGFEISFKDSTNKSYNINLKSNFSETDSNFLLLKEKINIEYFRLSELCKYVERLNLRFLDYFKSGSILLPNLQYKKGGFPKESEKYKQISTDWYYYEMKDPL